jgi:molybdopterin synthase catalytic subunit
VVDIAHAVLDPAAAIAFVSDPAFGGIALFAGRVRDLNHGRVVTGISYDLFDALALRRFEAIAAQAQVDFGPRLKIFIAHAKGRLAVGELAVVIAAGTPHRDEAFRACRQVIEAVKHTSPIWKQEHYADGDSAWSEGCSLCEAEPHADAGHDVHRHGRSP